MIIDVNAYLGPFAFRRLRNNTAASLLKLMDNKGIDRAVVSSASAITYRNTQSGNEELAEQAKPHRDRFTPFAVINPGYAGWRDDLKTCHEDLGMTGLRLYPKWHNYSLSAPPCLELIGDATERGMIISIPIRVEDQRERSWLIDVADVPLAEIATVVSACPKARFILLNGLQFVASPLGAKNNGLPANYAIEISRLDPLLANELGQLVDNLGPERIMFGTGMPFSEPDPSLLKMEVLEAANDVRDKILGLNAKSWLSEKVKS